MKIVNYYTNFDEFSFQIFLLYTRIQIYNSARNFSEYFDVSFSFVDDIPKMTSYYYVGCQVQTSRNLIKSIWFCHGNARNLNLKSKKKKTFIKNIFIKVESIFFLNSATAIQSQINTEFTTWILCSCFIFYVFVYICALGWLLLIFYTFCPSLVEWNILFRTFV